MKHSNSASNNSSNLLKKNKRKSYSNPHWLLDIVLLACVEGVEEFSEIPEKIQALANGRCSGSGSNYATVTSDHRTFIESAYVRGFHERSGDTSRSCGRSESQGNPIYENEDDEASSCEIVQQLEGRIDKPLELSREVNDLKANQIDKTEKREFLLRKVSKEDINEKRDKLLKNIKEGCQSLLKKSILCSPTFKRQISQEGPSLSKRSNQKSLPHKNTNKQSSSSVEKAIEESPLLPRTNIRKSSLLTNKISSILLKKDIEQDPLLNNDIQEKLLLPKKNIQQILTSANEYIHKNFPSSKQNNREDTPRTHFTEELTKESIEEDSCSLNKTILENSLDEEKDAGKIRLSLNKTAQQTQLFTNRDLVSVPSSTKQNINKNVPLPDKNISSCSLSRLTAEDIQQVPKSLRKFHEEEELSRNLEETSQNQKEENVEEDLLLPQRERYVPHFQLAAESGIQDNLPLRKRAIQTAIQIHATPVPPLRIKRIKSNPIIHADQSVITHRRCPPSEVPLQDFQDNRKVRDRWCCDYKLKWSPPPEEYWPGRKSTWSDNDGSADKRNLYNTKCKLADFMTVERQTERQSIAEQLEEQITITENYSHSRFINIAEENARSNSIVLPIGPIAQRLTDNVRTDKDSGDVQAELSSICSLIQEQDTNIPSVLNAACKKPFLRISNNESVVQNNLKKSSNGVDHQSDNLRSLSVDQQFIGSEKHRSISERNQTNVKMKLTVRMIRVRDKLVVCLSAFAILFTLFLVMDLQMDLGYSGHHLIPSHGRVKIGDEPNTDTVYNNFRRKFLQRLNGSREQASSDAMSNVVEKSDHNDTPLPSTQKRDDFADLVNLVIVNGHGVNIDDDVVRISEEDREYNPTIGELRKILLR